MIRRRAALLLAAAASVAGFAPTPQLPAAARVHADKPRQSVVMMPIGVPKVAYRVPGAPSADWIDIYNRLYRERIIFLSQDIDDDFANVMISVLLYLESEDSKSPVSMYFNVAGGKTKPGLALHDTMTNMPYDIQTVNMGIVAETAAFLVAGGTPGKRFALPNSRFLMQVRGPPAPRLSRHPSA